MVEGEKIAYQPRKGTKQIGKDFCDFCAFLWLLNEVVDEGDDPEGEGGDEGCRGDR